MKVDNLKKHKDVVSAWLQKHPQTRDSDLKLIANVWADKIGWDNLDTMSARELLKLMVNGVLPSSETIRRTRQKLQEENQDLRGKSYRERQNRGSSFRNDIKNL